MAAALLLTGCVTAATGPDDRQFAGFYASGFEVESFRPCGSQEQWWVTEAQALRARYAEVAATPYQEVYVVIRGEAGPEGRYGHLAAYQREVAVREVLELRAAREGDCG